MTALGQRRVPGRASSVGIVRERRCVTPHSPHQLAWQQYSKMKPRLLVSAPSNTAVDNIVLRIMEQGFLDGDAQRYNPSLIRFGRGAGEDTRAVSLEAMVQRLLHEPAENIKSRIEQLTAELQQVVGESRLVRSKLRALMRNVPRFLPAGWEARVTDTGGGWCELLCPVAGDPTLNP